MSFTGGYDLCIELGDQELTARASATLAELAGGNNVERDVELRHAVGDEVLEGNLHVFVTSLGMRSVESLDGEVEVVLKFDRSALRIDGAGSIDELQGEVTVSGVPVTIYGTSSPVTLQFDFGSARSATLGFRDAGRVTGLLRQAGLDEAEGLEALADAALDNARALISFLVKTPLTRTADGEDGDLGELRFVDVDVRTRELPDGSGGALCLFGNLLQSSTSRVHDTGYKGDIALRRGATSAVALDEAAVRGLVFCSGALNSLLPRWLDPMLGDGFLRDLPADAFEHRTEKRREAIKEQIAVDDPGHRRQAYRLILGDAPALFERRIGDVMWAMLPEPVRVVLRSPARVIRTVLPLPCGDGGVPIGDARLAELDLLLGDGLATLTGHAVSASQLADGVVHFRHDVRLTVTERTERDGTTSTELDLVGVGQPTVDNDLSPSLLAIELGVLTLGIVTGLVASKIAEAPDITRSALRDAVNAFATPDLPADLGAVSGAAIRPQALVVLFQARIDASRFRVVFPSLAIRHTEHRTRGTVGPRTAMQVSDRCHDGEYHYRDIEQTVEWTLRPAPTELTAPRRTTWTVAGRDLADGDGSLTLRAGLDLHYTVAANGASLRVRNEPGSGGFTTMVSCRAIDRDGLRATASPIMLRFDGLFRDWEPPYNEQAHACIERFIDNNGPGPTERPQPARGIGPVTIDRLRRSFIRDLDPVALRSLTALLRRNAGNVGRTSLAGLAARSAPRRREPG